MRKRRIPLLRPLRPEGRSLDRTSDEDVVIMAPVSIAFTQINLQHCKSASAVLARCVSKLQTSIVLVQEPWLHKGKVSGLRTCGQCFSAGRPDVRACILIKGVRSDVWAKHCGRDLTTVVIYYKSKEGTERKVVVCSAYFPGDAEDAPPPQEVRDLIRDCEAEGLDLVMGCDANSHHTVWGSSNCNSRGEALLEFFGTTSLGILNVGCKPTFRNSVREEVLDISLASGRVETKVRSWKVSEEVSMSDHRHITFELTDVKPEIRLWRNPRKTDWVGYEEELTERAKHLPDRLSNGCEIEHCADSLRECMVRSFENNCGLSRKAEGHGQIRWSAELSALRKEVRRLYNRSYRSKTEADKKAFQKAQKAYKKELERAGGRSWQNYCSEVDSLSDTARLCRVLRNGAPRQEGPLRTVTGEWAEDAPAVLDGLIAAHFPDARSEAPGLLRCIWQEGVTGRGPRRLSPSKD